MIHIVHVSITGWINLCIYMRLIKYKCLSQMSCQNTNNKLVFFPAHDSMSIRSEDWLRIPRSISLDQKNSWSAIHHWLWAITTPPLMALRGHDISSPNLVDVSLTKRQHIADTFFSPFICFPSIQPPYSLRRVPPCTRQQETTTSAKAHLSAIQTQVYRPLTQSRDQNVQKHKCEFCGKVGKRKRSKRFDVSYFPWILKNKNKYCSY